MLAHYASYLAFLTLLNDEMELGLPEEKRDDVTSSVRAATKCLARLLDIGIDPEIASSSIHESAPSLESIEETFSTVMCGACGTCKPSPLRGPTIPTSNNSRSAEEARNPHKYHTCLQVDKREGCIQELLENDLIQLRTPLRHVSLVLHHQRGVKVIR